MSPVRLLNNDECCSRWASLLESQSSPTPEDDRSRGRRQHRAGCPRSRSPGDVPQVPALPPRIVNCPFLPISRSPPPCVSSELCLRPVPALMSPGLSGFLLPEPGHRPCWPVCPTPQLPPRGSQGSPPVQPSVPGLGELERARLRQGCARSGPRLSLGGEAAAVWKSGIRPRSQEAAPPLWPHPAA